MADRTLFLSPSGYFSSCLGFWSSKVTLLVSPRVTLFTYIMPSSSDNSKALWCPFPAHCCSTGCTGLKKGPQILPSSSLQEADGATPAQPLREAGLCSSLANRGKGVCPRPGWCAQDYTPRPSSQRVLRGKPGPCRGPHGRDLGLSPAAG